METNCSSSDVLQLIWTTVFSGCQLFGELQCTVLHCRVTVHCATLDSSLCYTALDSSLCYTALLTVLHCTALLTVLHYIVL